MYGIFGGNQKLTSFQVEIEVHQYLSELLMHVWAFQILATVQLAHCDFFLTVQNAPLDYYDSYAEISVTIHNSPH